MGTVALILLLLTVVLEFAIGIRLYWLSRRTKGAAELAMGLAWIGDATGQVLNGIAKELEGTAALVVSTVDTFVSVAAIFVLALGVQRIFEPHQERLGRAISVFGGAMLFGYAFYLFGVAHPYAITLSELASSNRILALGVLGWMAAASFRASFAMRRQIPLGLSSPFEADRFLLWAIAATIFTSYVLLVIGRELAVVSPDFVRTLQPIMVFLSVGGIWVTFFPPRWLERRYTMPRPSAQAS